MARIAVNSRGLFKLLFATSVCTLSGLQQAAERYSRSFSLPLMSRLFAPKSWPLTSSTRTNLINSLGGGIKFKITVIRTYANSLITLWHKDSSTRPKCQHRYWLYPAKSKLTALTAYPVAGAKLLSFQAQSPRHHLHSGACPLFTKNIAGLAISAFRQNSSTLYWLNISKVSYLHKTRHFLHPPPHCAQAPPAASA